MSIELAWAAGFYEGEGSIGAHGHSLALTVPQVDREPLDRFASLFDVGSIRADKGKRLHIYRAYGWKAQGVAMALYPQLSRRRQAQILAALLSYAFRRVRDPERCQRGHRYADVGTYAAPNGSRECLLCRTAAKRGLALPAGELPRAIDLRWGIREYKPAPLVET